jgi:hypothetical protein
MIGPSPGRSCPTSSSSLPSAPATGETATWQFRRTDLDPFDHVNNAAQWVVLESLLAGRDRRGTAELEYLVPVGVDEVDLVSDGGSAWLVADGRTLTAMAWTPSS